MMCHVWSGSSIETVAARTGAVLAMEPMLSCVTGSGWRQDQSKVARPSAEGARKAVPPASPSPLGTCVIRSAAERGMVLEVQSARPGRALPRPRSSKIDVWSWLVEMRRTAPMVLAVGGYEAMRRRQGLSMWPG